MNKHTISADAPLFAALEKLNTLSGETMTLLVIDCGNRLLGTLTDGDIRRAFLRGATKESHVTDAMHEAFTALRPGENVIEKILVCRKAGIKLLPIINEEGRLVNVIDLRTVRSILPLHAVIMAGGIGERLRPLTLSIPKPLLEINGKPIIDYNVERLEEYGVESITVCCRYMADKIEAHFRDSNFHGKIEIFVEANPLGTIGAVALANYPKDKTVVVMNSDLLTDIPFDEMYLHHLNSKADITIAAVPYSVSVPYAILTTEGLNVKGLEEKPTYSYYANAGIYMISPAAQKIIRPGERLDAPDFIERALSTGLKVCYFPFTGIWIDIGSPSDYQHAQEVAKLMRNIEH